ncbi:MAG: histidine phosphatase family protein [Verrucomicrobia bacterium]|jgi:phosphohistidine phosphatase SixA|nr:histidine phosphatase family protein [Verrucomicrobiota bacterium]
MKIISILLSSFLSITVLGCFSISEAQPSVSEYKPVVVFAIRHAEKVDQSKDPELSDAGKERAALLAQMLRSAQIEYIHSSPYIRTMSTAAPTAQAHGVKVQEYDPRDLPNLVEKVRIMGGRHLIVGHSNTTPLLAELLTDEKSPAINEAEEFDRLYVLTVGKEGKASSVIIRYGKQFISKPGE